MAIELIDVPTDTQMKELFGSFDANVKLLEKELGVEIYTHDTSIKLSGDDVAVSKAGKVVRALLEMVDRGETLTDQNILYTITMVGDGLEASLPALSGEYVCITAKGKPIKAKTLGQKEYVEKIRKNTIVFGIGPAGTGKTYLAVAMAVDAFRRKEVSKIVLTRPAVEAGEKLGFLPGDLQDKVDPYLRPLYDALNDMLGAESYMKYFERGLIEVAPLAYMRGRTLDDAFIILDEAQNTTPEQMKMFLTRIGFGSKAIITGDITQIDLPDGKYSGLKDAQRVLKNIPDIEFMNLTDRDVVRHPLVQKIISAYEKNRMAHPNYAQKSNHKGKSER